MGSDETFREYLLEHPPGMLMVDADTIWVGVGCLAEAFDIAKKLSLCVTALEGFWCEKGYIVPDMEAIVCGFQFSGSWDDIVEENARQVRPFAEILKENKASFFELFLMDENEYKLSEE